MKKFDYHTLNNLEITFSMLTKMNTIYELWGQTNSYKTDYREELDRLVEVAKIQSTDASNRIEGIYTVNSRLKQIMAHKTTPRNRNEEEISGYRDVLKLIHEQYHYMPIVSNTILAMHKEMFSYNRNATWGGKFKSTDNEIITEYADGHKEVRFNPPSALLTPDLINDLCTQYNEAFKLGKIPPILLCGAFIFDFVSIHPFNDGNGRMSRLLMLLTMYQAGFDVGKYISIEKIIENTKDEYYRTLKESSMGWEDNRNSYAPFLNYFLEVVIKAYNSLNDRLGVVAHQKLSASELILRVMQEKIKPLSRTELVALIPQYSDISIRRALSELREQGKIKLIGRGPASKYTLNY